MLRSVLGLLRTRHLQGNAAWGRGGTARSLYDVRNALPNTPACTCLNLELQGHFPEERTCRLGTLLINGFSLQEMKRNHGESRTLWIVLVQRSVLVRSGCSACADLAKVAACLASSSFFPDYVVWNFPVTKPVAHASQRGKDSLLLNPLYRLGCALVRGLVNKYPYKTRELSACLPLDFSTELSFFSQQHLCFPAVAFTRSPCSPSDCPRPPPQ